MVALVQASIRGSARKFLPWKPSDGHAPGLWLIYSGEHRTWWHRNDHGRGVGYVTMIESAGRWTHAEVETMTRYCGPDRKIELVPDPYGPDAFQNFSSWVILLGAAYVIVGAAYVIALLPVAACLAVKDRLVSLWSDWT